MGFLHGMFWIAIVGIGLYVSAITLLLVLCAIARIAMYFALRGEDTGDPPQE